MAVSDHCIGFGTAPEIPETLRPSGNVGRRTPENEQAFLIGWWAAATVARASAVEDPGAVVIDEVAAQWLVLLAAPPAPLPYALAFLLFRIFDIWKPWPVRWADQHVKGGIGIMLDDLLAAVYAILTLWVVLTLGGVSGVRS
jgi:phosphatidylglycerophosphatase A